MTKLTIRNGKLYKKAMKTVGLAEYLGIAMDRPYSVETTVGHGSVVVTQREIAVDEWDTETTIDVSISRYTGGNLTEWKFDIEGEVLVDLKMVELPKAVVVTQSDDGIIDAVTYEDLNVAEFVTWAFAPDPIAIHYLDKENGETLKVWDVENGYAWEVE